MLTAADLEGSTEWFRPAGPEGLATPAYPPLASGKVRFVGEAMVIVVADSRALAEDACELVDVEIEPLVAITGVEDALDPSMPALFEEVGSNVVFHEARTYGDPDAAFRGGPIVSSRCTSPTSGSPTSPSNPGAGSPSPATTARRSRITAPTRTRTRCARSWAR